jgi:hypothetical protein
MNSEPPSDLQRGNRERHLRLDFVEEVGGGGAGGAAGGFGHSPAADRAVRGELLDRAARLQGDGERVELDQGARTIGQLALGQAPGMWAPAALELGLGAAQERYRLDHAAAHQVPEDPPDRALGYGEALGAQQHDQLGPAPHREVLAQPPHRLDQYRRPGRPPPARPAGARREPLDAALGLAPPAVIGRAGQAQDGARGLDRQALCPQQVEPPYQLEAGHRRLRRLPLG